MRVKLSYTVEEDTVLAEAAKIINLCAGDMQHAITLFTDVQGELMGTTEGAKESPNTHRAMEMLQEFRQTLMNVDTRLFEVQEIVDGYEKYVQSQRPPLVEPGAEPEQNLAAKAPLLQG
tara:strand:+ start:35 stop:391 length:357 start_codon:yes stop_codon:yes gene_type:complete